MSLAPTYYGQNIGEDSIAPEAILARFEEKGTRWAYELAEVVVLQCRFLGLTNGVHLPMGIALAWHGEIVEWPADVVAEVSAWRERCPARGTKVETPAAVDALLKQARKLLGIW